MPKIERIMYKIKFILVFIGMYSSVVIEILKGSLSEVISYIVKILVSYCHIQGKKLILRLLIHYNLYILFCQLEFFYFFWIFQFSSSFFITNKSLINDFLSLKLYLFRLLFFRIIKTLDIIIYYLCVY